MLDRILTPRRKLRAASSIANQSGWTPPDWLAGPVQHVSELNRSGRFRGSPRPETTFTEPRGYLPIAAFARAGIRSGALFGPGDATREEVPGVVHDCLGRSLWVRPARRRRFAERGFTM